MFNLKIVYKKMTTLVLLIVAVGFAGLWTAAVAVGNYLVGVTFKWMKSYEEH